jgi:uncharacterized protein (TIGR02271 family)
VYASRRGERRSLDEVVGAAADGSAESEPEFPSDPGTSDAAAAHMSNIQQQYSAREWIGHDVVDESGSKIGAIDEIYLDDASGEPEWLAIRTGWFGRKLSFAPIAGAIARGEDMCLPYSKDVVKNAPKIDPDGHLDAAEEDALYRYYGRGQMTDTGEETRADVTEAPTGDMTRSEEQLVVDKVSREAGRARLRKYVVTEEVTLTVPVQHEEARIVREPILEGERGLTGGGVGEDEREIVLHEERVVAHKEVVPKERVRLETEVVTEEQEVAEQLRKEQVELDEDVPRKTPP